MGPLAAAKLPPTDAEQALGARVGEPGFRLPSRRDEVWKWSDLRAALREAPPAEGPGGQAVWSRPPRREALQGEPAGIMPWLAAKIRGDAGVINLDADGTTLRLDAAAGRAGLHEITVVELAPGVHGRVIEHYSAEPGLANVALLYRLGEGARLDRVVIQDEAPASVIVCSAGAELGAGAELHQSVLAFGGEFVRLETHVAMQGEGARAELSAAYLVGGAAHCDLTSSVSFAAPGCEVRQLCKGVAAGRGEAVFQGKFLVERPAQKTDAEMRHDALLLSENAGVRAKPELEIYADDVACAHGNTLGQLDEAALFYARQRGVPLAEARAMLIRAFIGEALAAAPKDLAEELDRSVDLWLA